jgi:hypothetical protein
MSRNEDAVIYFSFDDGRNSYRSLQGGKQPVGGETVVGYGGWHMSKLRADQNRILQYFGGMVRKEREDGRRFC